VTCNAHDPAGNAATPITFNVVVNDTAPTLNLPADFSQTTTDPTGAIVTYTATATDLKDGTVTVNCTPASGTKIAVGTTTVNCSATNSSSQTSTGSFHVTVNFNDTTAPTIQSPGDQTVAATSANGANVSYTVTATDPDDPASSITIVCSPASGSLF